MKKNNINSNTKSLTSSLVSRRDFLKKQGQAALFAAAAAKAGLIFPSGARAEDIPDIAVSRGEPDRAVRAGVEALGGMGAFVKPGDKVVIKPNMSFAQPPENATNTHPLLVKALAEMCIKAGASKVMVLDNPLQNADQCMEMSGISPACSGLANTSVRTFNAGRFFEKVNLDHALNMKEADVMRDVLESDVLIAAPVAKSHSGTGVSLSMKGMMGLIRDRGIMHRRYNLSSAIVDLCTFLRADLTVIDATRVLASHGPFGPGEVIEADRVIASRDMVAADSMAVDMFPWYGRDVKPANVAHISEAYKRGLGRMDLENLNIKTIKT
ncbi:MAG: DUF362 domain-containing protein [Desulfonatronovibrio sp.]